MKILKEKHKHTNKQFDVNPKISNFFIKNIIEQGKEKYVRKRYLSDVWIRFVIEKHIAENNKKTIHSTPISATDNINSDCSNLEVYRIGFFYKLAIFLLSLWVSLFPFQTSVSSPIYDRYNFVHYRVSKKNIKEKIGKTLLDGVKRKTIDVKFRKTFAKYLPKTNAEVSGLILNIKNKQTALLTTYNVTGSLLERKIVYLKKGRNFVQIDEMLSKINSGKVLLSFETKNALSVFEINKIGEAKSIISSKPVHFVSRNFLSERIAKVKFAKNHIALRKEVLKLSLKTMGIAGFAGSMALTPEIFAQEAVVQVIPKDSQTYTTVENVLVNVYDENNNLVDSGVSTSEGVTFGLTTDVEDEQNSSVFKFEASQQNLSYVLKTESPVKIVLTDILGRETILFSKYQNQGKHVFMLNIANFSNGNYTLRVLTNDFYATQNFNKVGNYIFPNVRENITYLNKKINNDKHSLLKLKEGRWYKFVASGGEHFKDSTEAVISDNTSLEILMDKTKNVLFKLFNNDTDTLDNGFVIVGNDSLGVNGEANLVVPYSDTLKFVAGILRNGENFSFLRTKEYLPDDLPDTVKSYVVDFALRDINLVEVGALNEDTTMSSNRFKNFAKLVHFNYIALGTIGGYKGNNGKLPDSLVIADSAYFFDTNTEGYMEQVTIDRIVSVYDTWIKPLIGQRNIPIKIRNKVNTGDGSHDFGYVLVVPSGSTNVVGSSAIWRALPATIEFSQATLRSGQPYGDPGDEIGTRVAIQELWSCIFGYNPSVRNVDEIVLPNESVMHDAGTERPTKYDLKLVRITSSVHFEYNEPIEKILKEN